MPRLAYVLHARQSHDAGCLLTMTHTQYLLGDELFVLGSILFSVAAFISALLAVSEEASTSSKLKVSPYIGVPQLAAPVPPLPRWALQTPDCAFDALGTRNRAAGPLRGAAVTGPVIKSPILRFNLEQARPSAARSLWLSRRCTSWAASALSWRASASSLPPPSASQPAPLIRVAPGRWPWP